LVLSKRYRGCRESKGVALTGAGQSEGSFWGYADHHDACKGLDDEFTSLVWFLVGIGEVRG
jgi:hypothetical protein